MSKLKTYKAIETEERVQPQNLVEFAVSSGNLYKSVSIIAKRANQISSELKQELHNKLEEFSAVTDNLEEILENREQVEISKSYEKLPHATIIATQEFLNNDTFYREKTVESK